MPRIIHQDLSTLNYCNRGSRQFFERHGISWSDFLREGVDIELIAQIDDEMARKVVTQAKNRLGID